ncbi:tumor necrosis factor receptor superfamily member 14-like isoform X2 [Scleropages formosus]|nr:tumor necrosis factor receptor superfamily member 14-like isoform X2 [Scleropages formosus]
MFYLLKTSAIALLFFIHKACSECNHAQYEIDGKCCSMCSPGTHVYKHCGKDIDTMCVDCAAGTFSDQPNGVIKCRPCTACDEGLGLKTVKECKPSSDAVCGVLEGNYCIDSYEGGCRAAQKHTTCKPGHFIKHPGTDFTDTVCENCPENSHSDGFSTSCTPRIEEPKGLPIDTPEDNVSDPNSGSKSLVLPTSVIILVAVVAVVVVIMMIAVAVAVVYLKRKKSSRSDGDFRDNQNLEMTGFLITADTRQTQASQAENGNMLPHKSDTGNPEENGSPGEQVQQDSEVSLHSSAGLPSSDTITGE